jgi:hypothetical protein
VLDELKEDGFFTVGHEAIKKDIEEQDKKRKDYNDSKTGVREFWMNKDEEDAFVRFLTEDSLNVNRHRARYGGNWQKYTCTGNPKTCPLCLCEDPDVAEARMDGAHLIIDRRVFKSKKSDKEYTNDIKYLAMVSKHIDGFRRDADETEEKILRREWKMTRTGEKSETKYTIYPKPTADIPKAEKQKYMQTLRRFHPGWVKFLEDRGMDKEAFPLERYVVAKCMAPLPMAELQKIADDLSERWRKKNNVDDRPASTEESSGKEDAPPIDDSDDDYQF